MPAYRVSEGGLIWVFRSENGQVSWHGDATEEQAEFMRGKLEAEAWGSPTRMLQFDEADRALVEAEIRGEPVPRDRKSFAHRWQG